MIGRDRLHPPYAAFVSTRAGSATQLPDILRHAGGQDDTPIHRTARSLTFDRVAEAVSVR